MTMVGLTLTGSLCHLTNPPPTCYKPPTMRSITPFCNLQIDKRNKQIIRPTGHPSTVRYAAAVSVPSKSDQKSTMTHNGSHQYKLPIFPKLQKLIKMTAMNSKDVIRTTILPPSAPHWSIQPTTNQQITANLHGQPKNHTSSPPYGFQQYQIMRMIVPTAQNQNQSPWFYWK